MLLFQVFLYTACQLLLVHHISLLSSPPVAEAADVWSNCLAANVQWGTMWYILHGTRHPRICASKCQPGNVFYIIVPSDTAPCIPACFPGRATASLLLLFFVTLKARHSKPPANSPLSQLCLDITGTGAVPTAHSKRTINRHCHSQV